MKSLLPNAKQRNTSESVTGKNEMASKSDADFLPTHIHINEVLTVQPT